MLGVICASYPTVVKGKCGNYKSDSTVVSDSESGTVTDVNNERQLTS